MDALREQGTQKLNTSVIIDRLNDVIAVAHILLDKTEIDSNVELKIILEGYGKG